MNTIGGFIGLEAIFGGRSYHPKAVALATGRACLGAILRQVKPKRVFFPYYACDVLLDVFKRYKVSISFYEINDSFEPVGEYKLSKGEWFFYINYFGINQHVVEKLYNRYKEKLIIDNSQAFFERGRSQCYSFNSARKFFGVPDGAYLYTPRPVNDDFNRNMNVSVGHLLRRRNDEPNAYAQYVSYEKKISTDILKISYISEFMLNHIQYDDIRKSREKNFLYLASCLGNYNLLDIKLTPHMSPICYPLLLDKVIDKKVFYRKGIYIPTYWPLSKMYGIKKTNTKDLANRLLPLPIDQRYSPEMLKKLVIAVKKEIQ